MYDINSKEKTLSTSEKKENSHDGYVCMYECGKQLLYSMYERARTAQETNIRIMNNTVDIYNYEIKKICSTNRNMQTYIDICKKESENVQRIQNIALYILKSL